MRARLKLDFPVVINCDNFWALCFFKHWDGQIFLSLVCAFGLCLTCFWVVFLIRGY
jgi:hypothetical protein